MMQAAYEIRRRALLASNHSTQERRLQLQKKKSLRQTNPQVN